ncbi:MAG: glutamate racemase [Deltaproteobacteria bacterium]|nr:MAG: glutamate racemase [Deltaproteobacteria bacterium]
MIGVFDSGIGGLTVLKALMESIPDYDFIYFGDTARAPYGSKSPKTVITCTLQNIEFLVNLGAKVVVLACHTVASLATDSVSARYDMPIFDVITPAVKHAIKTSRYQRIGIIGTRATTMSAAYEKKIHAENPNAKVYSAACPLLVPLIEESWHKKPETRMIVKKCLHPFKVRQIDTLILGCSYYGLLTRMIRTKIGKRVSLIDPSSCLADVVKAFLARHREVDELLSKNSYLRLILSDLTPQIEKLAGTILQRNVRIEAGGP